MLATGACHVHPAKLGYLCRVPAALALGAHTSEHHRIPIYEYPPHAQQALFLKDAVHENWSDPLIVGPPVWRKTAPNREKDQYLNGANTWSTTFQPPVGRPIPTRILLNSESPNISIILFIPLCPPEFPVCRNRIRPGSKSKSS